MHIQVTPFVFFLIFSLACGAPINSEDDVFRSDESSDTFKDIINTASNSKLEIWDWTKMNLPASPWSDETKFGNDFYVDSAYDPAAVSLKNKKIRFYIDPLNPIAPAVNLFNYRAEIHTAPWPIKHPVGTEQWLGWKYTFGNDYVIDATSPITIFQNHPGVRGLSPQLELEIAALNTPNPAVGGEIQIINVPNGDRIVTDVKPKAGDQLEVVVHIVYGLEDQGLFSVWLNGALYYNEKVSTVYSDYPWGGNNKWGIYHHTFNESPNDVSSSIESGAGTMELFMGPLKTWTRTPSHPSYLEDAYELIRPEN